MGTKNTTDKAAPAAVSFDHAVEIARRRQAAAAACEKHEHGWRSLADRLADDFNYIEQIRGNFDEMKLAAKAGGVKITEAPKNPAHLFLKMIYPEKVRQRISEWAIALGIAHKCGWSADRLRKALVATQPKNFKKTYDHTAPQPKAKPAVSNAAASTAKPSQQCADGLADHRTSDGNDARGDAGDAFSNGSNRNQTGDDPFSILRPFRTTAFGDRDGRFVVVMDVRGGIATVPEWDEQAAPEPACREFTDVGGADDFEQPFVLMPFLFHGPSIDTDHADDAEAVNAGRQRHAKPATEHDITVIVALKGMAGKRRVTIHGASQALNVARIRMANGRVWYPEALKKLINRCGYDSIGKLLADVNATDDDRTELPPAARSSVPSPAAERTNATATTAAVVAPGPLDPADHRHDEHADASPAVEPTQPDRTPPGPTIAPPSNAMNYPRCFVQDGSRMVEVEGKAYAVAEVRPRAGDGSRRVEVVFLDPAGSFRGITVMLPPSAPDDPWAVAENDADDYPPPAASAPNRNGNAVPGSLPTTLTQRTETDPVAGSAIVAIDASKPVHPDRTTANRLFGGNAPALPITGGADLPRTDGILLDLQPVSRYLTLKVNKGACDACLALPKAVVVELIAKVKEAMANNSTGQIGFDGKKRGKYWPVYLDFFLKPSGADLRVGVVGADHIAEFDLLGTVPAGVDYLASGLAVECEAVGFLESLLLMFEEPTDYLGIIGGQRKLMLTANNATEISIFVRYEGLIISGVTDNLAFVGNDRTKVADYRISEPAPSISVSHPPSA